MRTCAILALASALFTSAYAITINVEAGDDFEASCLAVVQPGDTCYLAKGEYLHDGLTSTHGTADARITITGDSGACIKGSNTQDRALQIAHDYYTVDNICFDGQHGSEYVATAIYVLGVDKKSTKNGVTSSVTGTRLANLEIKNFNSECIHFRYFVTHSEVYGNTIQYCGREDFDGSGGGKVGEAIYVGTALDQVSDGKAPEEKIRSGGADNVSADVCRDNWIHHNTFRTYGNECVDVKEGSTNNIIEYNVCEQQRDANSGGFGLRGSENTVRFNEITSCVGAGIRSGGDNGYGELNNMYGNIISETGNGAFNVMASPQGTVCENELSDTGTVAEGAHKTDPSLSSYADPCESYPGSIDYAGFVGEGPSTAPQTEEDPDEVSATPSPVETSSSTTTEDKATTLSETNTGESTGVNGLVPDDAVISKISTNSNAGGAGLGDCGNVLHVAKVLVEHDRFADSSTTVDELFDGDLDTYYSIHRESTSIVLELSELSEVDGVGIGFFMKYAAEQRIQTFDIDVRGAGEEDEWENVYSRKESSGEAGVIETFPFTATMAYYVRFSSHGNTFNNWTAISEIEVCGAAAAESNAMFGGVKKAIEGELQELASSVCTTPSMLVPVKSKSSGSSNVLQIFDDNFQTRWSTDATTDLDDINNGKITLRFQGDQKVTKVKVAFFDGDLARPHFALYKESASDHTWTLVNNYIAEKTDLLQTFEIEETGVNKLYLVGHGNDVGDFTKVSELQVYGC